MVSNQVEITGLVFAPLFDSIKDLCFYTCVDEICR